MPKIDTRGTGTDPIKDKPAPETVTDTSVGGNQNTKTTQELKKATKVERLGIATIGARLDARERRTRDLLKETRPEIFSAARDAGLSKEDARALTRNEARQLNKRADNLHAGLLQVAPDLAADLLMSQTPTDELPEASATLLEVVKKYVQAQRSKAERAWIEQNQAALMGTADREGDNQKYTGDNVELMGEASIRARLQELDNPDVQRWLDQLHEHNTEKENFGLFGGTNSASSEMTVQYLQRLYIIATHPEIFDGHFDGAMQDAYNNLTTGDKIDIYAKIGQTKDGELVYIPDNADKSAAILLTEGVGESLMAPFTLSGKAGGAALRGVGAEGVADWIGEKARATETGVGYAVRALEGGAIGLLSGPGKANDYWPSWQEYKAGEATPVSDAFFDITGLDRQEYEGAAALIDMMADISVAEIGLRGGAAIKRGQTVPGVKMDGMEFLTRDPIVGKSIGDKLWEAVDTATPGKIKTTLINTWKGLDTGLADQLARETTKDGVLRVAARYIDDVAEFELPKVRARLEAVDAEITTGQRTAVAREISARTAEGPATPINRPPVPELLPSSGAVRVGMDEPIGRARYHWTTEEGYAGIVSSGRLEARVAPLRGEGEAAVWAFDNPTTYTAEGGRTVLLRIREDAPVTWRGAADELSTVDAIPAEYIDVYTGPQAWKPLRSVTDAVDPVVMEALVAERTALWQRITDLEAHRPVYEFPRPSAMRGWMRGARGRSTRLGRIMQNLFGESGKVDLSKLTDDFTPHQRQITYRLVRDDPGAVIDAVRKQMNLAKVPREGQVALIEDLLAIKSPQMMFRWAENLESTLRAGVTRGHTRWLTADMEETFKFAPRSLEERISSPVTREYETVAGNKVAKVENSLVDAAGEPMLTRPTQFLQEFWLPDMGLLREATSTIRWLDRWSKTQPWLIKAGWDSLHTPAKSIKTAATAIRHVVRPSVLLSPRLWGKIQFDQSLRRIAEGYMNKRWRKENVDYTVGGTPIIPREAKPLLGEYGMDETALGSLVGDSVKLEKTLPVRETTTRVDPNPGNPRAVRIVESRLDHLEAISSDPLMRRYIVDGPEGTVAWLRGNADTRLGRWFREDMEPYLAQHGKTVDDWLVALEQEVTDATFNNVGLRRSLATSKWETGRTHTTGAGGEARSISTELSQARAELSRTESGASRMELLRRIDELDRRLSRLSGEPLEADSFSIADRDAMKAEVFRLWEDGSIKMPDEVLVNRKMPAFEAKPPRDIHERILARTRAVGQKIYGGLRPLGKFDYSRRSTFTAVFRQVREDAIARFKKASEGIEPNASQLARIEETAAQRAAYITKDLHYDITARSSFDQSMKDMFWFSAVYREQIATWGYKIPSRSYWPIGAPLRLHEAFAVIDGLKAMGILEWDTYQYRDQNGEMVEGRSLVMNVPWITPFLQKLLNNTEVGKLNIEGLNPLTPGTAGAFPTISPVMELVLSGVADKAPDELKPFFDIAAELFTFDGDISEGPSFMPTILRDALGSLGIEVPFNQLSPAAWGEAYRKGRVQATRWAMSDLAEQGILPPQEAEKATEADIKEVYDELGIADLESMLTDTERGYLTGELTELEQEGLQDKLSPEQILVLVDYMDQAASIRAEYASTAEPGGVAYQKYLDQVNERTAYYRNASVVVNLLGSALFPGRFTDANGVTSAGEAYYDYVDKLVEDGYSYDDGSIYEPLNKYIREHPEAYPYSVGVHPGKYGTPTYDNQKTIDPDIWVEKALEQTHYWMDKAKKDPETGEIKVDEDVPEGNKAEIEQQFRERDLVNLATTRTVDVANLKRHDLDALGLPTFAGSEDLLNDLQRSARILERRYDSESTDSETELLYKQYDQNLKNVSAKYGKDGEVMLAWFKATPAERLRRANYFVTPVSTRTITQANAIASRATSDGSGLFSEEDIWGRINFYKQIEDQRQQNPAFDRELRRAELALGERGLEGRVATYEYLFFNIDEEWFGHFGTIAEGLR